MVRCSWSTPTLLRCSSSFQIQAERFSLLGIRASYGGSDWHRGRDGRRASRPLASRVITCCHRQRLSRRGAVQCGPAPGARAVYMSAHAWLEPRARGMLLLLYSPTLSGVVAATLELTADGSKGGRGVCVWERERERERVCEGKRESVCERERKRDGYHWPWDLRGRAGKIVGIKLHETLKENLLKCN